MSQDATVRRKALELLQGSQSRGVEAARSRGALPTTGGRSYFATGDQCTVLDRAIEILRLTENDMEIPEGRCLELIAADFLAGVIEERTHGDDST